jgi:uncharacterized protein (TIGR01244 family)
MIASNPMSHDLSQLIPSLKQVSQVARSAVDKQVRAQLMTGGQPLADAWEHLAEAGIRTVVNLRPEHELPGRDEAQEVKAAHLTYINIPIDGPASLSRARADELWQALSHAKGGVLVHCGTGNRCGAMLALTEAWYQQRDVEEAVAFGKQAGLTGMELAVRELLVK